MADEQIADLREKMDEMLNSDTDFNSKLNFLQSFMNNNANQARACVESGVSMVQVSNWKLTDKIFLQQYNRVTAIRDDIAESAMANLIEANDGPTVRFYLERRMPDKYGQHITTDVNVTDTSQVGKLSTDKLREIANIMARKSD